MQVQQLEKGVTLTIEQSQQKADEVTGDVKFINNFVFDNRTLTDILVEIDFTGSEDIIIEDKHEKDQSVNIEILVEAENASTIATVQTSLQSNMIWQLNWQKQEPSAEKLLQKCEKANQALNGQIDRSKKIFKTFPLAESSLEEIEKELFEATMKVFVDPEFPPCNDEVKKGESKPAIHWRRPIEFMDPDHPIEVFHKEIESKDIRAGPLSKKWLLCAISTLAERPNLVKKLFLTSEYKNNGAYRLQINKSGVWTEVTIDDYMPCQLESSPLFTRTNGNELWVQLLEKAYAKLHGGYAQLDQESHPNEALQDFTGFPTVVFDLAEGTTGTMLHENPEKVFKIFEHYHEEGYLLSATAPGLISAEGDLSKRENQLLPGHTYTILRVQNIYSHKLIQIRNQWGNFIWDGAWCKKSLFWTQDIQKKIQPKLAEDDGTFWMNWEDFCKHFTQINVCKTREGEEIRVKGQFLRLKDEQENFTDRIVSKWFYCMNIAVPTTVQMGIHQVDENVKGVALRRNYLDTGFTVFRRTADGTEAAGVQDFLYGRDADFELFLEPGDYVILPQTNGIALKSRKETAEVVPLIFDGTLTDVARSVVDDIFYRFDTLISNSIDLHEFNDMWSQMGNQKMTQDSFSAEVNSKHTSTSQGLTAKGLATFLEQHFAAIGEAEGKKQLKGLGYDAQLYSSFSRSFILSLHADKPIEVQLGDAVGTNLDDAALALNLERNGYQKVNQPEMMILQTPKDSQIDSYSFGAKNMCSVPLQITFSVKNCKNYLSSASSDEIVKVVQPGEMEFLMHLRRNNLSQEMLLNHTHKIKELE